MQCLQIVKDVCLFNDLTKATVSEVDLAPTIARLTPALSGKAPTAPFQIRSEPQQGPRPLEGLVRRPDFG
jgi:hypothetical protein